MISRDILSFGKGMTLACDARCDKAWGINNRPRKQFSDDPDDFAFLPDGDLGPAPIDPGTYEGGHPKPRSIEQQLNKWCSRECKRSVLLPLGHLLDARDLPDHASGVLNQPWRHEDLSRGESR